MLASRQGATGSLSNQDRGNSKAKASRLLTRSPPAMRARPRASRSEKPPSTLSAPALSKRSTSLTPLSASGRLIEIRVPPPASSAETCSRSPCSALSTSAPNSRNSSRSASSGSTAAATPPRDGRTAASTPRLPAISRNSLAPRSTSVPRSSMRPTSSSSGPRSLRAAAGGSCTRSTIAAARCCSATSLTAHRG